MIVEAIFNLLEHHSWLLYVLGIVVCWLLWRLWSFTIYPALHPEKVPYLPYSIPFLGHAIELFKDSTNLYRRAYQSSDGTRLPYSLQVGGEQIVIVTDPSQMSAIYNDNINYSWDPFIDMVYRKVGRVSEDASPILWRTPDEGFVSLFPNPKKLVIVHTGLELLHKQLLAPEQSQHLLRLGSTFIEDALKWNNISQACVVAEGSGKRVLSLHRWCRDVMVSSQAVAFFGPFLLHLAPEFTEIFDAWDKNSWMITYQYPEFLAKAATVPREKMVSICKIYLDTPRERRAGGAAFINELEDEMRHAGLSSEDCARILVIIMWSINSNAQLATFWMMNYILRDANLQSLLFHEVNLAMEASGSEDHGELPPSIESLRQQLLDRCPLLNATFDEVLRLCSTGCSVREVRHPVRIGKNVVPAGVKILMPQRQLLVEKDVFGFDAGEFNPQRFLKDQRFLRHDHYRPWGAGSTMCRGKFIARCEILEFVAWTLWRFQVRVVRPHEKVLGMSGLPLPRLDEKRPSLGVSKQIEGDDMMVELSERPGRNE